MLISLFYVSEKMLCSKQEYQLIESPEHDVSHRFRTRILLYCLVVLQLTILSVWASAYIGRKSQDKHNIIIKEDKARISRKGLLLVEEEIFEGRSENIQAWDGKSNCAIMNDDGKFDCYPEPGVNEELCIKRRCCWEPKNNKQFPPLNVPWCYYPKSYGGYELVNETRSKKGIRAFLKRTFPSPYPNDVKLLRIDVRTESSHLVHVKIVDATSNRFEPPYPDLPVAFQSSSKDRDYEITVNSNGFQIIRDNEYALFDSENTGAFIFADQFLQISATFPGKIYGIGEHQSTLQLDTNWTRFTLFNHDGIPLPNANLYGSHPFYLVLEPSGKSHGVFFHNSNAVEMLLQPLPAVTFRSIGGIFDFYFIMGPTPSDVIKQYTTLIGLPFLPPYWSLGFHLSRLGYLDTTHIRSVWNRTRAAKIPFDTQWHDIDYMDKKNDFTYDKARYGDLPEFVDEIHQVGMHYVPIVDPGISGCEPNGTYPPYDEGIRSDVFIKNADGSIFVGKVWNSECTVFPDFTAPKTRLYWSKQMRRFHDVLPFDGLWIDMNEPSNFLDGSFTGCPSNKWESPVYLPQVIGNKLYHKTVCMSTRQYAGLHYDVHNLYGISEADATNGALKELGKRPFIISRSTYPGAGRFAGHWSGDVVSTWHAMKQSIPQMLSFSLFGIPMMGADICGFNGNTTRSLCQRWSQLGAFYPFSRNHNTDDAIDQDPVSLGEDVVSSAKKALLVRYTLLPYLYTLFFKAHTEGETVARPIFFEFGNDPRTHDLDESFLWGCCLLIVPVLKEYATTVETYLPAARWYDWYTNLGTDSNGMEIVVHAPPDTIPVFIRGGVVLPTQFPSVTTKLSRLNDIELIAAANAALSATGTFYWDDGESLGTFEAGKYGLVDFFLTSANLSSQVKIWNYEKVPTLGSIKILGFVKPVKNMYFNKQKIEFKWNPTSLVLRVAVKHPINLPFVLFWEVQGA